MELIGERGLDAPSLDEICDRAGYTRGAFYVHFRDREDFLVAVMDRVGERFLAAVLDVGGDEAGSTLAATAARFLAAASSGIYPLMGAGGVRPHQLVDACMREPRIRARYVGLIVQTIDRLEAQVRRGQAEGSLRGEVGPRDVSALLLAVVVGAQTMLELAVPMDLPGLARATMTLLAPARPPTPRRAGKAGKSPVSRPRRQPG
jgi:AcrR family transcriptional regulator